MRLDEASSDTTLSAPGLTAVPETMLWTLHSRASEAARRDGILDDPKALEIYRSLDYDFERSFGRAEPTLAVRASAFDEALRSFLRAHPNAVIVNLGEGLETQRYRVKAPEALWVSVDLPDAIEVRERFIEPDAKHLHLSQSATDPSWFRALPANRPIYVAAQGLFMYLQRGEVRELLSAISAQLLPQRVVFDVIPDWLSRLSRLGGGLPRTLNYRTPPMPWGASRAQLRFYLRRWMGPDAHITLRNFPPYPRGPARLATRIAANSSLTGYLAPTIVDITL